MENLSIKDFIVERCIIGKNEGWKNLYSDIAREVYEKYGEVISTEQIRYISKKYRKDHHLDEYFNQLNFSDENINNENDVLIDNGFNPDKFSLVNYKTSIWTGVDGKEYVSKKVSVKPRAEFIWTKDFMEKLLSTIDYTPPVENLISPKNNDGKNILVFPIVDFHYMRFASTNFTNDNYDCDIARKNFYHIVNSVVDKYSGSELSKIYFIIGNDMINCDNLEGTTTKGTKQENCSNIEQAILELSNLLVGAINCLKKMAPVDVIYVPSNHDYLVSFGIVNALRLRYENDTCVNIDSSYKERKYRKDGICLLGFAHDLKIDKINNIIINDAKEYISETNRRIYFLGHLHHEQFKDIDGTEIRRMSSIAGQSRWEYNNGYCGIKKCQTFLIDPKKGITDIFYIYVD